MSRFILLFVFLVVLLFGLELYQPVQQMLVIPWTQLLALMTGKIMLWFDPDVIVQGKVISSSLTGFSVSIEAGCNGVEASLILVAAVLAYPSPWDMKFTGVVFGIIAIQLLNLLRVISLFYLGQWDMQWFEWAHLYIWQVLIILDALIVFIIWMRVVAQSDDERLANA